MIDVVRNDRVARLTINAPPVNVLDSAVLDELTGRVEELGGQEDLAALLIEGAGRCFSAGASVAEHRPEKAPAMVAALTRACLALAELPVPAVAMVHGSCLGGAMELISFCDFVVADPGSTLGQPEIKLAFFPPLACHQLPRLTGLQNAAYVIFSGEGLNAEQAAAMGLVQQILAKDRWTEIDSLFNGLSVAALRMTKRALRVGAGAHSTDRLKALEDLFLGDLYRLEDVAEGIGSFEERRRPEWRHR